MKSKPRDSAPGSTVAGAEQAKVEANSEEAKVEEREEEAIFRQCTAPAGGCATRARTTTTQTKWPVTDVSFRKTSLSRRLAFETGIGFVRAAKTIIGRTKTTARSVRDPAHRRSNHSYCMRRCGQATGSVPHAKIIIGQTRSLATAARNRRLCEFSGDTPENSFSTAMLRAVPPTRCCLPTWEQHSNLASSAPTPSHLPFSASPQNTSVLVGTGCRDPRVVASIQHDFVPLLTYLSPLPPKTHLFLLAQDAGTPE
eukprot:CAMPEP_0206460758 /NCGR_PEP_ID=MMETSP0324_2-20121206/24933_1 /ASSEMBLY_ACC=CAM_ASM_000836 /TAXON_ID=2866 /ORGANISM="Crypthecodinium cohnii, Strain Seligo" /LENGTH=254 /DNA_ID=CAMNT_0053932503 /DNA_START=200 /DNA_END=964 /DNA_ORIENTATION=+